MSTERETPIFVNPFTQRVSVPWWLVWLAAMLSGYGIGSLIGTVLA